MRSDDIPLSREFGEILMTLTEDFHHRLSMDLRKKGLLGVKARHRSVFMYLWNHAPCRAVELAQAGGIRPQSMMKIVHELEQQGVVERAPDPDDSRAKLIRFTRAGKSYMDELMRSSDAVWQQYAQILGEAEMQHLFHALKGLLAERDFPSRYGEKVVLGDGP